MWAVFSSIPSCRVRDDFFADSKSSESVPPDTLIGPYQLLELIGEGGMGQVWLAEQKQPVRRRVAIKLIKAGMDTREVVARFASERQALALMDHPAIAKVFDAGSTADGRPYFVMEYVAGIPITTYCDRHRLTVRQRMELFVQVCEGVHHAHQKAIIHRDLKPSNILVAEVDGKPRPRIIDFGVAKATTQKLTTATLYTHVGVLIGTLGYMSPEQADPAGEDIDCRTDVYSLGVVLFELLTGTLPFDLRKLPYDQALRRLREEDAPRPSTRLGTHGIGLGSSGGQSRLRAAHAGAPTARRPGRDRPQGPGEEPQPPLRLSRRLGRRHPPLPQQPTRLRPPPENLIPGPQVSSPASSAHRDQHHRGPGACAGGDMVARARVRANRRRRNPAHR